MGRPLVVALAALLVFAGAASAGNDPSFRPVWNKTIAVYTAQARQHGLTADCQTWNRVVSLTCSFTRRGNQVGVVISEWREPCRYRLTYATQGEYAKRVELDSCKPRWWAAVLPAPWTKRAG